MGWAWACWAGCSYVFVSVRLVSIVKCHVGIAYRFLDCARLGGSRMTVADQSSSVHLSTLGRSDWIHNMYSAFSSVVCLQKFLSIGPLLFSVSGRGWLPRCHAIREESRRGLCDPVPCAPSALWGRSSYRRAVCTLWASFLSISTSTGTALSVAAALSIVIPTPLSLQPRRLTPRLECFYAILPKKVFMLANDFYDALLLVCDIDKFFCVSLRADLVGQFDTWSTHEDLTCRWCQGLLQSLVLVATCHWARQSCLHWLGSLHNLSFSRFYQLWAGSRAQVGWSSQMPRVKLREHMRSMGALLSCCSSGRLWGVHARVAFLHIEQVYRCVCQVCHRSLHSRVCWGRMCFLSEILLRLHLVARFSMQWLPYPASLSMPWNRRLGIELEVRLSRSAAGQCGSNPCQRQSINNK